MRSYDTIKRLAKEHGVRVADLIALAPANDPFYVGRPAETDAANWFARLWHEFGYTQGVHLRRIHYRLVSQDPAIFQPNGKPYENTLSCWAYLNNASKYARYLNLVDPEAFVDRRNPDAKLYAKWQHEEDEDYQDPTPGYYVRRDENPFEPDAWYTGHYNLPDLPTLDALSTHLPHLPTLNASGYWGIEQSYHVEVWAEKSTMDDILIPLCQQYNANLVTGAGELSITAVILFLERARAANRPARILYVSDYDPAGLGMPISVARKVEFFQYTEGYDALDIRLEPVMLTAEQVRAYDLPRTPIKDSDLRKATWEELHGEGATELDALEALHPGEMARIIERAMLNYYDPTLSRRAQSERSRLSRALAELEEEVSEPYLASMSDIEADYGDLLASFDETRREFDELVADFQPAIEAHTDALEDIKTRYLAVYGLLYDALERVELDAEEEFPLPDPDLPEEAGNLLYISQRDYIEQLGYYQSYRNGGDR